VLGPLCSRSCGTRPTRPSFDQSAPRFIFCGSRLETYKAFKAHLAEEDLRVMAVVMESWCIAGSVPARELEKIPKDEVHRILKKSGWTKEGSNSFDRVRTADVDVLRRRSPEFKALCERLRALSSG
jgi:hypothetical protein